MRKYLYRTPRASRLGSRNTEFPAPFADADRTRIPVDRLPRPLPCEAPPEPHFTIVTNDVGMRFRALVIPLPIREVGIGGTLPETDTGMEAQLLASAHELMGAGARRGWW